MHVACKGCGRELTERAAWITVEPMADEEIHSWFLCPGCDRWTVEVYCDTFLGEPSVTVSGPIPRERGDAEVARLRTCPDPDSHRCQCEVHRTWGRGD